LKNYILEMLKRKDLLVYLVISGLKAQTRNTWLGYAWWILDPLLMGAVYFWLRVVILNMEGEGIGALGIGAFLIIGLVGFKWIRSGITGAASSVHGKAGIITQVYLPKAIFPFGTSLTEMINFSFSLLVVAFFLAYYGLMPGITILYLPVIMAVQFMFVSAIGLVLAYVCTFVRDLENLLSHLMRVLFYASPVIWETGRLPEEYSYIVDANPISTFLMGYREVLMAQGAPDLEKLFIIAFGSLAIIFYMIYFYYKNEHKIIKAL